MSGDIDSAAQHYQAASAACAVNSVVDLQQALTNDSLYSLAMNMGRAQSHIREAGGGFEATMTAKLQAFAKKLGQAHDHYVRLRELVDELVPEAVGLQGELMGIAQTIAATGQI